MLRLDGALTHSEAALLRVQLYAGRYQGEDIDYAIIRLADYDEEQRRAEHELRNNDANIVIKGATYSLSGLVKARVAAACAIAAVCIASLDIVFDAGPVLHRYLCSAPHSCFAAKQPADH